MTNELNAIVKASLRSFWNDIEGWYGREREMVSLFCFRHLLPHCQPGTVLHDAAQIGIEVAVPQLSGEVLHRLKCKRDVCKDVVIWAEPKLTVWDCDLKPCREPLSVMEWKVINQRDGKKRQDAKMTEHGKDKEWLLEKSRRAFGVTGYAVFINSKPRTLTCARVSDGAVQKNWLVLR